MSLFSREHTKPVPFEFSKAPGRGYPFQFMEGGSKLIPALALPYAILYTELRIAILDDTNLSDDTRGPEGGTATGKGLLG